MKNPPPPNEITHSRLRVEGLWKLLFEHARDIILFLDPGGRLVDANDAAIRAYGYSRAELLAMHVADLRAPETLADFEAHMKRVAAGSAVFQTVHRRKDGTTFWVEVSAHSAAVGDVRVLLSIVRDVTERRRAEAAAERARAEFVASMSHELRTPLNAILGFGRVLAGEQYGPLTERQRTYLRDILQAGEHMLRQVNGLLAQPAVEPGAGLLDPAAGSADAEGVTDVRRRRQSVLPRPTRPTSEAPPRRSRRR